MKAIQCNAFREKCERRGFIILKSSVLFEQGNRKRELVLVWNPKINKYWVVRIANGRMAGELSEGTAQGLLEARDKYRIALGM